MGEISRLEDSLAPCIEKLAIQMTKHRHRCQLVNEQPTVGDYMSLCRQKGWSPLTGAPISQKEINKQERIQREFKEKAERERKAWRARMHHLGSLPPCLTLKGRTDAV